MDDIKVDLRENALWRYELKIWLRKTNSGLPYMWDVLWLAYQIYSYTSGRDCGAESYCIQSSEIRSKIASILQNRQFGQVSFSVDGTSVRKISF